MSTDGPNGAGAASPRLSCVDSAFPRLSHAAALRVIGDLGFEAVDICVWAGYDHTPPDLVVADPARAADVVGTRLEQEGLVCSDVFGMLGTTFATLAINDPDEQVRAETARHFDALVEFATRLSAPGITILPGVEFDEHSLDRSAHELQRRAEIAGEAGLGLSVEPHYDSIVPTPQRALELMERTTDVTYTLDLSHFAFQGIAQAESDALFPHTRHVHLRQGNTELMQTRVDEGDIDFHLLRDGLVAAGYDGWLAVEYQWEEGWLDFTRVDCISETAELRALMLEGS